jgi:hypothetical protein
VVPADHVVRVDSVLDLAKPAVRGLGVEATGLGWRFHEIEECLVGAPGIEGSSDELGMALDPNLDVLCGCDPGSEVGELAVERWERAVHVAGWISTPRIRLVLRRIVPSSDPMGAALWPVLWAATRNPSRFAGAMTADTPSADSGNATSAGR